MLKTDLFVSEFKAPSSDEWLNLILREIGGDRSIESLKTSVDPDIKLLPFYRSGDDGIRYQEGGSPLQPWRIGETVGAGSFSSQSDALEHAEFIEFKSPSKDFINRILCSSQTLNRTTSYVQLGAEELCELTEELRALKCSVLVNYLSDLHPNGDHFKSAVEYVTTGKKDHDESPSIMGAIDATEIAARGAGMSSQIALLLSGIAEWCIALSAGGIRADSIANQLKVIAPVHSHLYTAICGLRALRLLLPQVVTGFTESGRHSSTPEIRARIGINPEAGNGIADQLIPLTCLAVSAALGNPDSISIGLSFRQNDESNREDRRLALNVLLLLRHEANLSRVEDALAGSYFIEHYTDELAKVAWQKFTHIEATGGIQTEAASAAFDSWIETDLALAKQIEEAEQ